MRKYLVTCFFSVIARQCSRQCQLPVPASYLGYREDITGMFCSYMLAVIETTLFKRIFFAEEMTDQKHAEGTLTYTNQADPKWEKQQVMHGEAGNKPTDPVDHGKEGSFTFSQASAVIFYGVSGIAE